MASASNLSGEGKSYDTQTEERRAFKFLSREMYLGHVEPYGSVVDPDGAYYRNDEQEHAGYVEVARALNNSPHSWIDGNLPRDDWYFISIPASRINGKATEKSVFVKFNHSMNNCFAIHLSKVPRKLTPRSKDANGDADRNFYTVEFGNNSYVTGIENAARLIEASFFDG